MIELVEVTAQLSGASNATLLAKDRTGVEWVYKPIRGEQPLWDFDNGTLAVREILTFLASEAMQLGIVPNTEQCTGPFGPGSAQAYVEADPMFDPRSLFRPSISDRLWPFAALDLVTNNADRKLGHFLLEKGSGRLLGIDHGLTFHSEDKLRTVLWGFSGRPIPASLVGSLRTLQQARFAGTVAAMLGDNEADACADRIANLLADPVHPEPPDDRPPIPWPVW